LREEDKEEEEDLEGDLILVWEILKDREGRKIGRTIVLELSQGTTCCWELWAQGPRKPQGFLELGR
jgi:hypothetical protein